MSENENDYTRKWVREETEGYPTIMYQTLYPDYLDYAFEDFGLKSLKGIGKHWFVNPKAGQLVIQYHQIIHFEDSILGLLLLPRSVDVMSIDGMFEDEEEIFKMFPGKERPIRAWMILERHLEGDRDLLDCQEELIEAGYGDYAEL